MQNGLPWPFSSMMGARGGPAALVLGRRSFRSPSRHRCGSCRPLSSWRSSSSLQAASMALPVTTFWRLPPEGPLFGARLVSFMQSLIWDGFRLRARSASWAMPACPCRRPGRGLPRCCRSSRRRWAAVQPRRRRCRGRQGRSRRCRGRRRRRALPCRWIRAWPSAIASLYLGRSRSNISAKQKTSGAWPVGVVAPGR